MLFLVVALVLLAVVLGSAAYLPGPVSVVLAVLIACWLVTFAVRERRRRGGTGRA